MRYALALVALSLVACTTAGPPAPAPSIVSQSGVAEPSSAELGEHSWPVSSLPPLDHSGYAQSDELTCELCGKPLAEEFDYEVKSTFVQKGALVSSHEVYFTVRAADDDEAFIKGMTYAMNYHSGLGLGDGSWSTSILSRGR